jgi:malonate-semialdehyde dehydrogenase (acetylating)/methylmalonate-semialdehyde dehydrogenase
MKYAELQNYVGGDFVATRQGAVGRLQPEQWRCHFAGSAVGNGRGGRRAVQAARAAFPAWSAMPIKERVQVFYKYKTLLEQNVDELAALITEENGKITSEARAEVLKSAELSEFACSLPQITPGEVLEVSRGVECRVERFPLGVVASIAPFNFPNMVPNWTIPNAIALGNCMILKPSELVPISAGRIAELLRDAGLPAGVFQVVHGGREAVEAICDHPDIAAVSFVGSTRGREDRIVARRPISSDAWRSAVRRIIIVMPDADREMAATNIVASCPGARVSVHGRVGDGAVSRPITSSNAWSCGARDGTGQGCWSRDFRSGQGRITLHRKPRRPERRCWWTDEERALPDERTDISSVRRSSITSRRICGSRKRKSLVRCS